MSSLITTNKIALQYLMTDDLYVIDKMEVTVVTATETAIEENQNEQSLAFNYLGENNRYLLLLVKDTQHEFLPSAHLEMLIKILKARQMELRDVAILNLNSYKNVSFDQLKVYFAFKSMILFGVNPQEIGLSELDGNRIQKINENNVLATFSFSEMQSDDEKKRTFWNEMKKL